MVRGGNKTGGLNSNNGGNRFANLEVEDRSQLEDPFHLNNGDHPDMSLVSSLFTGNNINSWSRAMHMALIAKNKFSLVDGTISKPDIDDLSYRTWSRCNNMVTSWVIHAVSKEIAESIMYIDNACDVWADLHERFHQSNGPIIFQIKQQLSSLSQGS
ncbi:hypothetical protein UlMin_009567 [Ulmus minor]